MRRHDRALRRAVLRLVACVGGLPRAERRVLVLRAGVGISHTRSRRAVARMTRMRRTTVARLERRGLRRLRKLARTGGCAVASGRAASGAAGTASATAGATPPGGMSPGGTSSGIAAGIAEVLGEHRSGVPQAQNPSIEGTSGAPSISRPGGDTGGSPNDLRYPLLALTLALFAFALVREVRRNH